MEAIIRILFTPDLETGVVTPLSPQYAGTQHDNHAAYVAFTVPPTLRGASFCYRIEGINGTGSYVTTPLLPLGADGTVGTLLGTEITAAGGQAILRLVVSELADGQEVATVHSFDGRVYFADAAIPSCRQEVPDTLASVLQGIAGQIRDTLAAADTTRAAIPQYVKDGAVQGAVEMGTAVSSSGAHAVAAGFHTEARGFAQIAVGRYNVPDSTSLLLIGNGSMGAPSNAVKVCENGAVVIGAQGADDLAVATKKYVDDRVVVSAGGEDYIVETGSGGYWEYRVWHSGLCEIWGRVPANSIVDVAYGSFHKCACTTATLAWPKRFSEYPTVVVSSATGGAFAVCDTVSSADRVGVISVVRPTAWTPSDGCAVGIYAKGRVLRGNGEGTV